MAFDWLQGFVVGAAVAAAPSLYFMGVQNGVKILIDARQKMVGEIHKAVVDVGGRIGNWFNKGGQDNGKLEKNIDGAVRANRAAAFDALVAEPGGERREYPTAVFSFDDGRLRHFRSEAEADAFLRDRRARKRPEHPKAAVQRSRPSGRKGAAQGQKSSGRTGTRRNRQLTLPV